VPALVTGPYRWVRGWELWSLPRRCLVNVILVDVLAVLAILSVVPLTTIDRTGLVRLGVLFGCMLLHIELTRKMERERLRRLISGIGPYVDSFSLWHVAAAVMLPPLLACALVAFGHGYGWFRVIRGTRRAYRWVYSDASIQLATVATVLILRMGPGPHPGLPLGWAGIGVIALACLVRWFINYAVIVSAVLASSPTTTLRQALGEFGDQLVEAGTVGMGIVVAGLLEFDPPLVIGIVAALLALYRSMLLTQQYRIAARSDPKTGLFSATWWHEVAERAFSHAAATRAGLGVLMLDLDHFKQVNDTHGHLAGDAVLRAVAEELAVDLRQGDAIGRWGGEEFAILLPDVPATEVLVIAERIRVRVHRLAVQVDHDDVIHEFTVSIGGAHYPGKGISGIDDLLVAADTALYAAKQAGRDQVCLSRPEA
jgi:diguanylate cyclase (GGDEF)-like protein